MPPMLYHSRVSYGATIQQIRYRHAKNLALGVQPSEIILIVAQEAFINGILCSEAFQSTPVPSERLFLNQSRFHFFSLLTFTLETIPRTAS